MSFSSVIEHLSQIGILLVRKDCVVLPRSTKESRLQTNLTGALKAAQALTNDEVNTLDGVAAGGKQYR